MLASIHADMCASNPSFARFSADMGLVESVVSAPEPWAPFVPLSFDEYLSQLADFNAWAQERERTQVLPEYVEQLKLF